ncbi:MAG: hypothetical protein ACYS9X_29945 [Planctomycetota bacterium]|jgi:hypothetical protein
MKRPPIPREVQVRALARRGVWQLLMVYSLEPTVTNVREHITVTKGEVAHYLATHREEAEAFIRSPSDPLPPHESLVLEKRGDKYVTYWVDHGSPRDLEEFANLEDAAADYVMYWL